jgi:AraC-like DNA-binding protein
MLLDRLMQEIAKDVGFGGAARMNDTFRRELGITPSEYRRQRQLHRRV